MFTAYQVGHYQKLPPNWTGDGVKHLLQICFTPSHCGELIRCIKPIRGVWSWFGDAPPGTAADALMVSRYQALMHQVALHIEEYSLHHTHIYSASCSILPTLVLEGCLLLRWWCTDGVEMHLVAPRHCTDALIAALSDRERSRWWCTQCKMHTL